MKKPTIKTLKKKCDILWSQIIRKRDGKCVRCGKTTTLQAAHIFGRANLATRFSLENGLALCYACHFYWAHKEPYEFSQLVDESLAEGQIEMLERDAKLLTHYKVSDYEKIYKNLQIVFKHLAP